jgi:hypothetical protein
VVARGGHARHDRFAIAEALGGGPLPPTVGLCPACGAFHRDLLSIQTVLRHAWVPRRPRDLRLTTADVARLRPVLWLRLLLLLGSSRDTTTRPLAVALTSLGIAGFALANVSLATIGTSGAAAASAPPESATSVAGSQHGQPAIDQRPPDGDTLDGETQPDPVIVLSAASLVAGGGVIGLRRIAAHARAMR